MFTILCIQSDHGTPINIELVEINARTSTIAIDLIYATSKNFTGQIIYTKPRCLMRKEVACVLENVQQELTKYGFGLKIWDAYRPMTAQQKFWDVLATKYPDEKERERYVANPKSGGRHTRGTAIDCTLISLKTGKEVQMPTAFDHFGPEAWSTYEGPALTPSAKKHRDLLAQIMKKHGFETIQSEWWHFDFKGWQNCPTLDIEF